MIEPKDGEWWMCDRNGVAVPFYNDDGRWCESECDREYNYSDAKPLYRMVKVWPLEDKEWNGEELPPVGCECEVLFPLDTNPTWYKCIVEYTSVEVGVIDIDGQKLAFTTVQSNGHSVKFRPIETPEQKAARERKETAMQMFVDAGYSIAFWNDDPDDAYDIKTEEAIVSMYALYDLGYRKPE